MNNMDLIAKMPQMLSGKELYERLTDIPEYSEDVRYKSQTERLMALSTLYDIYLPSEMSVEIYSKLYLALLRSLQKKGTQAAVQQSYQNYNAKSRYIKKATSSRKICCSGLIYVWISTYLVYCLYKSSTESVTPDLYNFLTSSISSLLRLDISLITSSLPSTLLTLSLL